MSSLPTNPDLLRPVIALNIWTLCMEAWMYATRIPATNRFNAPLHPMATKEDFNAKIPAPVRWKADNYNHLHEQPTCFYAVALTLACLGGGEGGDAVDVGLAWTYVGLRVAHSLVQSLNNRISLRFFTFGASSFVLAGMTVRAGVLAF